MNDSITEELLEQLADVQAPTVSQFPANGWWLLLGFCLFFILILALFWRRYRSLEWYRQAVRELRELRQSYQKEGNTTAVLCKLSVLLRRVMIRAKGRHSIASVQGHAWVKVLNETHADAIFTQRQAQIMQHMPYQRAPAVSHEEILSLFESAHKLLRAVSKTSMIKLNRQHA